MVFMGSKKYPDENSFDDFIQKHGGTDNAATDCETTVFYFEAQRKHFQEGQLKSSRRRFTFHCRL
jgi:secreted Zn-dependent insulinase-like peptidase